MIARRHPQIDHLYRVLRLGGMLIVGGCATAPAALTCAAGQQVMLLAELLFGRNVGDRMGVSERSFAAFVDEEVTPRFPGGLTILDAKGQYRDMARGAIVREPSKVIVIAVKDEEQTRQSLAAIAEAYKRRFDQQSVGMILRPACVSF
jgi:hypothetical protein